MANRYQDWAAERRVPLGFALGIAYVIFAQPTRTLLDAGAAVALLGVVTRGWAAGYLDKDQRLATAGPYAYTRNPLYLGSFLIGSGFALAGRSLILGAAFLGLFLLVYRPVMRREAEHLRRQFGEVYNGYARAVPLLFPGRLRRAPLSRDEDGFRWTRYKKNREYEAALGYIAGVVFLALKIALR